jgi:hypothetical protein
MATIQCRHEIESINLSSCFENKKRAGLVMPDRPFLLIILNLHAIALMAFQSGLSPHKEADFQNP